MIIGKCDFKACVVIGAGEASSKDTTVVGLGWPLAAATDPACSYWSAACRYFSSSSVMAKLCPLRLGSGSQSA